MKTKPATKTGSATAEMAAEVDQVLDKDCQTAKAAGSSLKLRRILVPIDFSDCSLRALDYALALGERFEAKLILLHVVEPAVYPENYLVVTSTLDETNQNLMRAGRERLEGLSQKRVGSRVAAETLVRIGRAPSEISDTAKALAADMIIIGTHGYTGLKHVLLGSTAERVVRHAPCPVLTVRQAGPAE